MLRKFAKHTILFFIPVILGCVLLETATRKLPMRYTFIAEQLESNKDSIEVLVLGSSQMKNAVNPEWLELTAINMASGNQHLNTDFKLYEGLKDRLPSLNTVVLELSYAHLEMLQNKKEFWKNNIFHEYYDVNCFQRPTWLKDRLIFFSNPPFYSDALYEKYIEMNESTNFNAFGYDLNNYDGVFKRVDYNHSKVDSLPIKITNKESKQIFSTNSLFLKIFLQSLERKDLNVIIVTPPTYKTYLKKRNVRILRKRDSVLTMIERTYSNVSVLRLEEDSLTFKAKDYINHNHLNPDGARKFTAILNDFLRK